MTKANDRPTPRAGAKGPPPASPVVLPASGPAPPRIGGPLAAYRAALAKVEPGEAFLARTRQALAGAGEPAAGQLTGSAAPGRPEDTRAAGQSRPLRPGMPPRALRRARLAPLKRGLLPAARLRLGTAACLALLLLAVPAGGLLRGHWNGGASLSPGGAAAQAADEALVTSSAAAAVAEDTSAAETAPAEDYSAPAGEPAAADRSPADGTDTPSSARDSYSGAGASGGDTDGVSGEAGSEDHKETGGAPPADGEIGSESAEEGAPADGGADGGEEAPVGGLTQKLTKLPAGAAAERIRAA